jgi:hypothetical protein
MSTDSGTHHEPPCPAATLANFLRVVYGAEAAAVADRHIQHGGHREGVEVRKTWMEARALLAADHRGVGAPDTGPAAPTDAAARGS